MVFKNRPLRRIFRSKTDEIISWRKLYNEELHNMYSSPNIIRMIKSKNMRWAGHVTCMGEKMKNAYRILVGKSEGKRPVRRARRTWKVNIIVDLRNII
jgi:hypothetical protein